MINSIIKDFIFYITLKKKIPLKNYFLLKKASSLTMTSIRAQLNFIEIINYININNIKGDIVECGVWKGGNLFLAKKLSKKSKLIYGYDTFNGHIKKQFKKEKSLIFNINADIFYKLTKLKNFFFKKNWNYANLNEVKKNLKIFNSKKKSNIKLIQGDIKKTFKNKINLPKKIALLRLDTDWYEPTLISLKKLYPLVSKGGVIIIDDYGSWSGCKKAVDFYFKNKKFNFFSIDHSAIFLIKN